MSATVPGPYAGSAIDFQRIFEATPAPQLILTPALTIVAANDAYLKATMRRREDIVGRPIFDVFPDNPDNPGAGAVGTLQASFERVLKTGLADTLPLQKYDIPRPTEAGGGFEERWWSPVNTPVLGDEGQVSYLVHRVEDVTDFVRLARPPAQSAKTADQNALLGRIQELEMEVFQRMGELKDANLRLQETNEHLHLALQASRSGTFEWDAATDTTRCSDEFLALYGFRRGEFGGRYGDWLDCLLPEDKGAAEEAIQRALQTGLYELEFRIRRQDTGEVRWLQGRARLCFDAPGTPKRLIGIDQDITERKRLEDKLRRMNEQLESRIKERTAALVEANEALARSNLELQQFAYIAAHDLQTPLRSIAGFAQLLHMDYHGRFDSKADTWLDQLRTSSARMYELIQDLLTYSRVDSQGRTFQPTDIHELFREVLTTLDVPIRESGATVTSGELPVVMGDRTQLAQVLQNLIGNAIKYRGSAPPEVEVSARRQDDEWLFAVRDNGIGIAEKHLERIFEIFHRLHTQQEYPGTGIGLAVCRRVIHRHGGRIWVESEPGQGSVFYFTLPYGIEASSQRSAGSRTSKGGSPPS